MSRARASTISDPAFRLSGRPDRHVIIRLVMRSHLAAPAVVRPEMDDWVDTDGRIIPASFQVEPSYAYLRPGAAVRFTLSTKLPAHLDPESTLRSVLRFPGVEEELLPVVLDLEASSTRSPADHQISLTLPLAGSDRASAPGGGDRNEAVATLLAGIAGLEVIPARWLASELVVTLCEAGERFRETPEGSTFLEKLERTRFYKNGALAFRGAHVMEWVMVGATVSSGLQSVLRGESSSGRMLFTWERWLLNLVDIDIEAADEDGDGLYAEPPRLEDTLDRLGTDSERWFSSFVLGLTRVAPRIRAALDAVCAEMPERRADEPGEMPESDSDVLSEKGSLLK